MMPFDIAMTLGDDVETQQMWRFAIIEFQLLLNVFQNLFDIERGSSIERRSRYSKPIIAARAVTHNARATSLF